MVLPEPTWDAIEVLSDLPAAASLLWARPSRLRLKGDEFQTVWTELADRRSETASPLG